MAQVLPLMGAVAVLVLLGAIGQPLSKDLLGDFISGWNHAVIDSKDSCMHPDSHCHWYILLPGKGFANQTKEFVGGYITGWCSVHGNQNGGGDADQASWDCREGPQSASRVNTKKS